MARPIEKLTVLQAQRFAKKPGMYGDGGGLWLCVSSARASSWLFRYQIAGRAREMGLGSYPTISLSEARARARDVRRLKAEGVDPIADREARAAEKRAEAARAITFRQCAESYIAAHQPGWKNAKHAAQWTATLDRYVHPLIGDLPVHAVDVALVHQILEPIWAAKSETAGRVRGRMEAILDWATTRGYRQGENPARWKGHLENLFPRRSRVQSVKHHAALPYREIGDLMASLRKQAGTAALALQFTILTAARTEEVRNATWDEIDLEQRVWTVPAGRMKAGREHRVPLSGPALAVLKALGPSQGLVFKGAKAGKPLSNMAMLKVRDRMDRKDLTIHGFRSTFRDWAAEQTHYPSEVAEAALAHVVGDKVEAAYRRGDLYEKRRRLMQAWSEYCSYPAATSKVIQLTKSLNR